MLLYLLILLLLLMHPLPIILAGAVELGAGKAAGVVGSEASVGVEGLFGMGKNV